MEREQLVTLTADIVSSHVANNSVAVGDISNLVQRVYEALSGLGENAPAEPEVVAKQPVVSVRASVKPDYIVCMECGKKQKTLKRHLQVAHGMTPDQYRQDYGLPKTYPMVAPNYAEQRRTLAHSIGLGRKGRGSGATPAQEEAPAKAAGKAPGKAAAPAKVPAKRGRPKKAAPEQETAAAPPAPQKRRRRKAGEA